MFGNFQWFQPTRSVLPKPDGFKGWIFYLIWVVAILCPIAIMLSRSQIWQSGVWTLIASAAFYYDVSSVKKSLKQKMEMDSLFFIGDEESQVSTRNYELNLKTPPVESK